MMLPKHKRIVDKALVKSIRGIGYCEHCGINYSLQVHHITSRGAGGDDLDDNLICLCASCHTMAHAGNIGRDELRRIAKSRGGK